MAFHAGFDTDSFPGHEALAWLKANTPLAWCGYYLAPAPSHAETDWMGQRAALAAQGWGMVPVYLGQQTVGPGSHLVTQAQGGIDGAQAAQLARGDGFPAGTTVILDWEDGTQPTPVSQGYIRAWVQAVVACGYQPGLYCSHVLASGLVAAVAPPAPSPLPVWAWKVAQAGRHRYAGDIQGLQAFDPAGCGYSQAAAWQFEQDAVLSLPGTPCDGLCVDISCSTWPNS